MPDCSAMPSPTPQHDRIRRVVLEAADTAWPTRLQQGPPADTVSLRLRRSLNLPTDVPIVGTGHQPGPWHPGIIAKALAADAIAERFADFGVAVACITVDHQPVPTTIRLPVRNSEGTLLAEDRQLAAAPTLDASDRAIGWLEPFTPISFESLTARLAVDPASTLLSDYHAALLAAREAHDASAQLRCATDALLSPFCQQPIHHFTTTSLARTPEFAAFVRAMLDDAPACVSAYNAAVRATLAAGVAPLDGRDPANPELPLWLIDQTGRSRKAFLNDVITALTQQAAEHDGPLHRPTLLPRAITMTGFLRRYAVDAFIHGTGGGVYDTIAEHWLNRWLNWSLAPMLVVTADVELPIHATPTTDADLAHARWLVHHAQHNPAAVHDTARAAKKQALVNAIAQRVATHEDAQPLYANLHELLRKHRTANDALLRELEADAAAIASRLRERSLATDRAWTAALQTPDTLAALRRCLASVIADRVSPHAPAPN